MLSREVEDYLKVAKLINEEGNIDGLSQKQKSILFSNLKGNADEHFKEMNTLVEFFNYLRDKFEYDPRDFAHYRRPIVCVEEELRRRGNPRFYYLEYGGFYSRHFIFRQNWFDIFEFKKSMDFDVLDQREGDAELLGHFPLRNRMLVNKTLTSYVKLMNLTLRPDIDKYTLQLLTDDPKEYSRVLKEYGDKVDKEILGVAEEFTKLMFG